jgi:hypothetical protein
MMEASNEGTLPFVITENYKTEILNLVYMLLSPLSMISPRDFLDISLWVRTTAYIKRGK